TVPSEIIDVEGIKYLRFVVSHLSPFAIYKYAKGEFSNSVNLPKDGESVIQVSSGEALAGNLQITGVINTLNKSVGDSLDIKWFIIVILFALAFILFLWKDKERKK
nr:hypothetical protein [Lachnospiraceae bacterium]